MSGEEAFPNVLLQSLWHTTHPVRYQRILDAECILPNPPVPDSERWKTSRGPHYYPYVRTIGGVSLFDFFGFDVERYTAKYPLSSWREFVPFRKEWGEAIWIEIDRPSVAKNLIGGENLIARWKQDQAERHTIMPLIEVAHIGPVPLRSFRRVFKAGIDRSGLELL